ncbi:MAG: hypothetical protein KBI44_11960 [Thermoanaerobaculia bacterium]|nr:hypothetical protein [Thermoanaerobaculia bacterium]
MNLGSRERRLLLVLAAFAGVAALRGLWVLAAPAPLPQVAVVKPAAVRGGADRSSFGKGTRRGALELPKEIVTLALADPDRQPGALAVGRDPFRFGPPPAPPPPPPPTREELAQRAAEAEARRRAAEEDARQRAIPRPPPVTLVYLGSFGTEARRIAVFADDKGENLYNVRVGEIVEGKFIVDRIGYESVDLKFVGFPDEPAKRLPIGG